MVWPYCPERYLWDTIDELKWELAQERARAEQQRKAAAKLRERLRELEAQLARHASQGYRSRLGTKARWFRE